MKFSAKQINKSDEHLFKSLHNPRLGVSVRTMPAKIGGCFQKNYISVNVDVTDSVLGNCNSDDHYSQVDLVVNLVNQYKDHFSRRN